MHLIVCFESFSSSDFRVQRRYLRCVEQNSLLNRQLGGPCWVFLCHSSNVHVCLEAPFCWNVPLLLDCLFCCWEDGHVLQVGAQAFQLEGSPDLDLCHGIRMLRPLGEHVCGGLVSLSGFLDSSIVFPKGYTSICSYKCVSNCLAQCTHGDLPLNMLNRPAICEAISSPA
jgi:hypothetical protein